jgi:hypothetical protein
MIMKSRALILLISLAVGSGQSDNCCEQCKKGVVVLDISRRRTEQVECNSQGGYNEMYYPQCSVACLPSSGYNSINIYCRSCLQNQYTDPGYCKNLCVGCPSGTGSTGAAGSLCLTCNVGTKIGDTACEICVSPTTTINANQLSCNACVAGWYRTSSECLQCSCPVGSETYINCPRGSTSATCTACSGTQFGSYCGIGQEPGGCTGKETQNLPCRDCPAGKHKPEGSAVKNCYQCPTGKFKAAAGAANCASCTVKPAQNSFYEAWGMLETASVQCKW